MSDDAEIPAEVYEQLESEVEKIVEKLRGVPMSPAYILAHFLVFSSILSQHYQLTDEQALALFAYSRKCKLVAMPANQTWN